MTDDTRHLLAYLLIGLMAAGILGWGIVSRRLRNRSELRRREIGPLDR